MLEFIDQWWNVPYLVMLGLVLVFFALSLAGLLGDHDAEADVDAHVDVDADADLDADVDVDADGDGFSFGALAADALAFFGVGRVPFVVVWMTLFTFAGLTGIGTNGFFYERTDAHYTVVHFAISLVASLVVGLSAVRVLSRFASRFVDTSAKGASKKHELAGRLGVVASSTLDERFGEVRVRDDRGNEILVHARLHEAGRVPQRGESVVLVDYDERSELFSVTAYADESNDRKERQR